MSEPTPTSLWCSSDGANELWAIVQARLRDGDSNFELALGHLRYEALRKLTPLQFAALHKRNLAGENFDEMVDVLVLHKIP